MQRISKKITLEQFKSRLPLSYPAIRNGKISFVNENSLKTSRNGNYNAIPFSLSENICGSFSMFTARMGEIYAGRVLPYKTIETWYTEFLQYYELIYHNQCNIPFSSATDYYSSIYDGNINDYAVYGQMDENHEEHGGDKFYRWIIDNYFITLDFRDEYFKALDEGIDVSMTYPEWMTCLNELSTNIMSFPDADEFYGELTEWYVAKRDGKINCCDDNKYEAIGGDSMYYLVRNWIEKTNARLNQINTLVNYYQEELMPAATITININKKVEDLGNFISFSKEYVPGKAYNIMNVCTYQNDVYILLSGDGNTEDPKTGRPIFDTNGWRRYSEYYRTSHPDEFYEFEPLFELSGRTVSALDSFERTVDTTDMLGNSLPGHYKASQGSKFMQPAEGTMLDIRLEIGKVINDSLLASKQYTGDVLLYANIFFKSLEGEPILSSVKTCYEGDSFLAKIEECIASMNDYEQEYEYRIYVDFVYYKGCKFVYVGNKIKLLNETNGSKIGIKCIDHCYVEEENTSYYLSPNNCYPVRYYEIHKDIENHYSEEFRKNVKVAMCDWFLQPAAYDLKDEVISPGFRREETLGFSSPESTKKNIYIDRGYATVLDKHLKICEAMSYESLEKYGNGSFRLINLEEESV